MDILHYSKMIIIGEVNQKFFRKFLKLTRFTVVSQLPVTPIWEIHCLPWASKGTAHTYR